MKHNVTLIVSGNKDQYSIYAEDENLYVFGVGDTLEEAYNDMLTTVSETSVLSPQLQNPYPDWFLNGDYTFPTSLTMQDCNKGFKANSHPTCKPFNRRKKRPQITEILFRKQFFLF